ncbi:ATP-binding cassette domain-containing protein [Clostridium thermarum]|uniref:ATP-binding cassette domain-containing protein n=1 Tax=Clostridium thermarum TaxID=1716543 RepID=UPI0013D23BBD
MVDGVNIRKLNATEAEIFRRRKVGLIYQFYNLIPNLTVRKNMLMSMLLDKRKPAKEYSDTIVSTLGIGDKLEALPRQLSGRQQQRVAIARALIYFSWLFNKQIL